MFYTLLRIATLFATILAFPALAADGGVRIHDPYVRLAPPGASATGAFMLIKNTGTQDRKLVKAESPAAKTVELHTHIDDNGVMKMRQVESIEIPARGEAVLKPGSLHVMLFEVRDLSRGTPFPLVLTLDDGQTLTLNLPVKPVEPAKGMQH